MSRSRLIETLIPLAIAIGSLLVSGWVGYSHERESSAIDIAVLQSMQRQDHERLQRIENKLDAVLEHARAVSR